VGKNFDCSENQLVTLEGAPREVGSNFVCHSNKLNTLRGSPREVGSNFYCANNPELKTLDGIGNVHGRIIGNLS
jgi:hypothetical protein